MKNWFCTFLFAASTVFLSATSALAAVPVSFLQKAPTLDGRLDDDLRGLLSQPFPEIISHPETAAKILPTYRVAYGTEFFYLYVELHDSDVVSRDRAYQNGDGFQVVLAHPNANSEPTREFYVMGFSTSEAEKSWRKKFVWYHDVDLRFGHLKETTMATHSENGITSVELLLPWKEVYPYHPWLSDGIGFNLCYVKAQPEKEVAKFCVLKDGRIDSEQSPRRYVPLQFESPVLHDGVQAYAVLERNHIMQPEPAQAKIAVLSASAANVPVRIAIRSLDGRELVSYDTSFKVSKGVSLRSFEIPSKTLVPGEYEITAPGSPVKFSTRFGVLPSFNDDQLADRLSRIEHKVATGSFRTLQFQLDEIRRLTREMTRDDTARELVTLIADFIDSINSAERGQDRIATRTGVQRRAYLSGIDHTLQPYTVSIPEQMQSGARYPLLVYLHGSGEDDRHQLERWEFPRSFIQLAPRARGTSNAYTAGHAQDDIREAIDDVIANYPVDQKRIVLVGFSMGGYGVYRTFYETPERYRAIAIFSGHPNIAPQYVAGTHPNFLDIAYLRPFAGVPVFIFHGGQDRNCPIELTNQLVESLKTAHANVEFHLEEAKGHERASEKTLSEFRTWLAEVSR